MEFSPRSLLTSHLQTVIQSALYTGNSTFAKAVISTRTITKAQSGSHWSSEIVSLSSVESLLGEKRRYYAFTTTVRMNHLSGTRVRLVISYKDEELDKKGGEPSFYISNILVWEAKKILQTYAFRWSIEGFHRDAKQSLGLEDYQMRKISGVKRHISMVFFAYILLQLGSGFDTMMKNLKANLRTIGSRCRMAGTEVLSSLVRFVVKMAHKDMDARKIMELLTQPLEKSNHWR